MFLVYDISYGGYLRVGYIIRFLIKADTGLFQNIPRLAPSYSIYVR